MAIDYSNPAFALPKSRNRALVKADRDKALAAQDTAENAKARRRAGGFCEVFELLPNQHGVAQSERWYGRCNRKDTQTHHLKGGIGRRNKGDSILAINKLRVCQQCHADITAKILKPTTAVHDALTVRYWRER